MKRKVLSSLIISCMISIFAIAAYPAGFFNNYQHLVGDKAAGMGGAFTAVADDGSSLWYNPAGLAGIKNLDISLSGNAYAYTDARTEDYIRINRPSGSYESVDLEETDVSAVATSLVFGKKLGQSGTLAAGVFVPYQDNLTSLMKGVSAETPSVFMQSQYSNQSKLIVGMLGWGRSFFDRLNVGASLAIGYFNETLEFSEYFYVNNGASSINETYRETMEDKSLLASVTVGLQFKITENNIIGLRLAAPYLSLWGTARETYLEMESGPTPWFEYADEEEDYDFFEKVLPGMYSLGYAFTLPQKLTISAEVELVDSSYEADKLAVNCKVGAEVFLSEKMVLRVGFFTDFSQMEDVDNDIMSDNYEKIDYYGATLSFSFAVDLGISESAADNRMKRTWTTVGVMYRHGVGQVQGYSLNSAYDMSAAEKDIVVNHVSLFLGETISF